MHEIKSHHKILISSEKNFGIVISTVLLLIGIYQYYFHQFFIISLFIFSGVLLILAIFFPSLLKWPNYLWFKLGNLLGYIISPLIMLLIFYITITPIGIIMRILGKDLLGLKISKSRKSYWIERKQKIGSMKNQF